MGYDMYAVEPDAAAATEKEKWQAKFHEAVAKRDALGKDARDSDEYKAAQEEVEAAYEGMDAADTNYFRLNIWGMGEAREALYNLGILNGEDAPRWPEASAYGLSDEDVSALWDAKYDDPDSIDPESPQGKYLAAHEAVLAFTTTEPGISAEKFGSNDGWLVTPDECREAFATWTSVPPEDRAKYPAYVAEFVEWMNLMATRGGFTVH